MKKYKKPEYIPYDMSLTKEVCGEEYPGYVILDIRLDEEDSDNPQAIYMEAVVDDDGVGQVFYLEVIWETARPKWISCEKNTASIHDALVFERQKKAEEIKNIRMHGTSYQNMHIAMQGKYGKVFSYMIRDLAGELKEAEYFEAFAKSRADYPGWYRGAKPTPITKYHGRR